MCDESHLVQWARRGLSRREFSAAGGMAAVAACAPIEGGGGGSGLTESQVTFKTPAGTADGLFIHPAGKRSPAVLFWPDIAGIREAKRVMARRLAGEGYAVLLMNPYYRDVAGEQFTDFADFASNDGFKKVGPWREKLDFEAVQSDTRAAVEWLDSQTEAVDYTKGVGVQGYCMTGSFALWGAAATPRIKAAGSFHGGGLVRDTETSPHRTLRQGADYLVAIAKNDDAKEPEAKTALREAATAAGADAEIEVYAGDHGWCVPDSPSYNEPEAERAWARLLATYASAL